MAELALAIAPLCLMAITGIHRAHKKLKILRHHGKEIKRLRKKFTAQADIFLDECQLLLQDFLDPKEAEALIEATNHPRWNSPQLSEQIRSHLGRKYEAFSDAVNEVKNHIGTLSEALDAKANSYNNHTMKEAVDVMLNKSKYESLIEGFKESNQDIKRLRKTASKIQRCQIKGLKRSRLLPPLYQEVMQHSRSFHDALRTFWSCIQAQHTSHEVRLLLESRNDGSLRIIMRYHTTSGSQVQDSSCGGYLDTPDQLRHHVYPACNSACDHKLCLSNKGFQPSSLDKIFRLPVERSISVPAQVRLALRLVKGVLQFHSTPWLQPYWRLQDLSYFQTDEGLAASLDTLHISTELSKKQKQQQQDTAMVGEVNDTITAQLSCGIRNLTMHSLGVALLQIGQWDPINSDDVVEVRRVADLAERDSRLGPRYQKITQQCLDCDFGFGKDLCQPELQSAIYKDVVCELESLIYTLEGKMAVHS
ncbi:hypothetical protein S7711_09296 [Stachybotrys chartarum IBT 7711]|uniref:DUF7580 domain-containing protein n=1 Tax=Stachybotrys chartarum (strain CBS 109288 / IBT 7711) TaxID=1280523 RepID=A0A084AJM7_STACB|nr:hypothetical protein S7711_09296 [Stachybotrys chartarum IBT 7711]KFA45860.1 hypothetical protein S40293_09345 [Stachybotrys chartarum IBT 40293]